jgi:inosine-uridine nucleoside N-ribohydrolase
VSSRNGEQYDLIVDTDTLGINDDALALYYLLALGRVPTLISTVFGNASAASSARHAQALIHDHQLDIEVAHGCEKPVRWDASVRQRLRAAVGDLPEDTYLASLRADNECFWGAGVEDGLAPEAVASALRRSERTDVLAIGPTTNIARVVELLDPSVFGRHRLWVSGGSIKGGNVTADAEFNAFTDPDALQKSLSAVWQTVTMVPLDVLEVPRVGPALVARVRCTDTPLGRALDKRERESPAGDSKDREPIWDVVVAVLLSDEGLAHVASRGRISVNTDLPRRGKIDFTEGRGPHRLVTSIDASAVVRRFEDVVTGPRAAH